MEEQIKKWFPRIIFIILPTLIMLLFFAALTIETVGDSSMGLSLVLDDFAIIFSLFLPFVILGVSALLISINKCEKAVRIIKIIAGVLFAIGALYFIYEIIVQLPKLNFDYPLPIERYLRTFMLLLCAVSCFLPKRFVVAHRVIAGALILSFLATTLVPDIVYGYDYITVIQESIVEVFPVPFSFVSLIFAALFPLKSEE